MFSKTFKSLNFEVNLSPRTRHKFEEGRNVSGPIANRTRRSFQIYTIETMTV